MTSPEVSLAVKLWRGDGGPSPLCRSKSEAGFLDGRIIARDGVLSDVILDHLRRTGTISPPAAGRLVPTPA